jgi:hypothetical protein
MVLIHQSNGMTKLEKFIRALIRDPTILENFDFFFFYMSTQGKGEGRFKLMTSVS